MIFRICFHRMMIQLLTSDITLEKGLTTIKNLLVYSRRSRCRVSQTPFNSFNNKWHHKRTSTLISRGCRLTDTGYLITAKLRSQVWEITERINLGAKFKSWRINLIRKGKIVNSRDSNNPQVSQLKHWNPHWLRLSCNWKKQMKATWCLKLISNLNCSINLKITAL